MSDYPGNSYCLTSKMFGQLQMLSSFSIRRAPRAETAEMQYAADEEATDQLGQFPEDITSLKWLQICYVDYTVINFLKMNARLLSEGISLSIAAPAADECAFHVIKHHLWPLIKDRIAHLEISSILSIDREMLEACHNIELIEVGYAFPDFTTTGTPEGSIAQWLLSADMESAKVLRCSATAREPNDFVDKLRFVEENFENATRPANFIICIYNMGAEFLEPNNDETSNAEFVMLNFQTAEKLLFERFNEDYWMLVRCPMARDEWNWETWENTAIEWK